MHKHAGHIAAHHGHHQAGQVFVAGANGKNSIPLVTTHRGFHAVSNQFTRNQRKAHARMGHGQTVADRDHRALMRHATTGINAGFGVLGLIAQIHVARAHLPAGMKHADVRAGNLFLILAQTMEKTARTGAQSAAMHGGRAKGNVCVGGGFGRCAVGAVIEGVSGFAGISHSIQSKLKQLALQLAGTQAGQAAELLINNKLLVQA